jgi:hypothetical protein
MHARSSISSSSSSAAAPPQHEQEDVQLAVALSLDQSWDRGQATAAHQQQQCIQESAQQEGGSSSGSKKVLNKKAAAAAVHQKQQQLMSSSSSSKKVPNKEVVNKLMAALGWKYSDLQKRWVWKYIWMEPKPTQFGYVNPHGGYWSWQEVWTPSTRQKRINSAYDLREAYDKKLDARRKWCLSNLWKDWRCAVSLNKLQLRATRLPKVFSQWHNELCRVQCVRRKVMTNILTFIRTHFKQWHNALVRVQSMKASQLRRLLWYEIAEKQTNTLTIVFHLWLGILKYETRLDIMMQVGQVTQFLEVQMLFERWLQHVHNRIGCAILDQTRLFCISTDV